MKLIKVLALSLCLAMVMSSVNVWAINEIHDTMVLFDDNFEDYTVGTAASSIKDSTGTSASTATVAKVAAADENHNSKSLELLSGAKLGAVFTGGLTASSGKLIVEFDANLANGNVWLSLLYSGGLGTRAKWFFGTDTSVMRTATNNVTIPSSSNTVSFKDEAGNDKSFRINEWDHYKIVIDIDRNCVSVTNGSGASAEISGYSYIQNQSLAGIGIYNASPGSRFIDNLNVTCDNGYTAYIFSDNMDGHIVGSAIDTPWTCGAQSTFVVDTKAYKKSDAINTYNTYTTTVPVDGDNTVMGISNKNFVKSMFEKPVTDGIIYIEADIQDGHGGGGIGIIYEGENTAGYKYPYWIRSGYMNMVAQTGTNEFSNYQTSDGKTISRAICQWFHIKLTINASTGEVTAEMSNGGASVPQTLAYIGGTNPAIGGIMIYNNRADASLRPGDQTMYVDNFKVYRKTDGNAINSIETGKNKLLLRFKDSINAASMTAANISITSGVDEMTVENVTLLDSKTALVEFGSDLTVGKKYQISFADSVKYADGYTFAKKEYEFTASERDFSVTVDVSDAKYSTGETAKAVMNVTATDLDQRNINMIIAAYKSGKLTDVNIRSVSITSGDYGVLEPFELTMELNSDADKIKAFAWSDMLVPLTIQDCEEKATE